MSGLHAFNSTWMTCVRDWLRAASGSERHAIGLRIGLRIGFRLGFRLATCCSDAAVFWQAAADGFACFAFAACVSVHMLMQ